MDEKRFAELLDAKDKICNYCGNDDCGNCKIHHLIDEAYFDYKANDDNLNWYGVKYVICIKSS